jgi:DNA mismatch repair protein MutS
MAGSRIGNGQQEEGSPFESVLFLGPRRRSPAPGSASSFADLNLDQVLDSMTAGREEYELGGFFSTLLHDVDAVHYRHEVMRDLEQPSVLETVTAFGDQMRTMREHLAQAEKLHYERQRQAWFLDAVVIYCDAVRVLSERLVGLDVRSRGLRGLRGYLAAYVHSETFTSLATEADRVKRLLADVRYSVHVRGDRVTVGRYEGEPDYSADVLATFARFQQGAARDYRARLSGFVDMNHVEARILDLVGALNPEAFGALEAFCARHREYLDPTIRTYDREVQFYLAYLDLIGPMKAAGLAFCYPRVSSRSKHEHVVDAFDLALANKLVRSSSTVVCNDVELRDGERVLVVSGPNQGGKTTFARMFGQLHHLAALGLPVPGREARLLLPDRVFAHFEREEDVRTLRGKLEDELVRIRGILAEATDRSVLVMNESFTSTTLADARLIGEEMMRRIIDAGMLCVYVTFVDELASLDEATVSMVATVAPDNPEERTFRVVRRPADGLAYAAAIAAKYGLTRESVKRRVAS